MDIFPRNKFYTRLSTFTSAVEHPATHSHADSFTDNLYSPFYYGDSNVTEGKQFWISCRAEPPIRWYKDGEPIERHFVRHSDDEPTYSTRDFMGEDFKGKVESKLSVSRAVLRHKGKYQCNIKHENSHYLHVHQLPPKIESDEHEESFSLFEPENDHEDHRMSFETPIEEARVIVSTAMSNLNAVTFSPILTYDDDMSHEKYVNEPSTFNGFVSPSYETTSQVIAMTTSSPAISLPSLTRLTNIPTHAHPTHETTHSKHVVHTTHVIPSEVTQNHLEQHLYKGSQKNDTQNDSIFYRFKLSTKFLVCPLYSFCPLISFAIH